MSLAEAIANAGGIPGAFQKNDPIGTSYTGTIISAELRQVTDIDTGKPENWDDGSPKQQVSVTMQTTLRDPSNPEDDGKRRVYIKWWGDQKKALIAAIKAAGDTDLHPGGQFTATFSGEGEPPKRGFNAPKHYAYQYVKPPTGLAQAVAAQPAPQQVQGGWPAQPAPAPIPAGEPWGPPAPAAPGLSPDLEAKVAQMRALSLGDAQIAAALGIDVALVAETPF